MTSVRHISELLQMLLDHISTYGMCSGLCEVVHNRRIRNGISSNEQEILKQYIRENPPFVSYFRLLSPYYWTPGKVKPRIKWLKKHIEKTQKQQL